MTSRTNIYQYVTNQIVSTLENGVAPWRKPWAVVGGGMPQNVVSGKQYRGVNIVLLWATAQVKGYDSNLWGTYKQWNEIGGQVERGQKATKIVFWNITKKEETDKATGEEKEEKRFFCKQYSVFNLDQCSGESLDRFRVIQPEREFTDFGPCEEAIAATGADIRHGGGQAYYRPSSDYIQLPIKESFESEAAYYSTALHELTHWSGHESRLNRIDKLSRFGSKGYAAEELVAEMGASFLAASLGVPNAPIQDNAAYLQNWLEVLNADSKFIFTASTAASVAADFILAFSDQTEPAETEESLAVA